MARSKRRTSPPVPDAVREAVERTVQATVGTRERAQDAVDEIVSSAGAGIRQSRKAVTERVREAIDERRPATHEDLRELLAEVRAIRRRLDAIEERLPARRSSPGRKAAPSSSKKTTKRSS